VRLSRKNLEGSKGKKGKGLGGSEGYGGLSLGTKSQWEVQRTRTRNSKPTTPLRWPLGDSDGHVANKPMILFIVDGLARLWRCWEAAGEVLLNGSLPGREERRGERELHTHCTHCTHSTSAGADGGPWAAETRGLRFEAEAGGSLRSGQNDRACLEA
jgi:hypothetical protein